MLPSLDGDGFDMKTRVCAYVERLSVLEKRKEGDNMLVRDVNHSTT